MRLLRCWDALEERQLLRAEKSWSHTQVSPAVRLAAAGSQDTEASNVFSSFAYFGLPGTTVDLFTREAFQGARMRLGISDAMALEGRLVTSHPKLFQISHPNPAGGILQVQPGNDRNDKVEAGFGNRITSVRFNGVPTTPLDGELDRMQGGSAGAAVSTVRNSVASTPAACERKNSRQLIPARRRPGRSPLGPKPEDTAPTQARVAELEREIAEAEGRIQRQVVALEEPDTTPALRRRVAEHIAEFEATMDEKSRAPVRLGEELAAAGPTSEEVTELLEAKPILTRAELDALPQAALRELFESLDLQVTYLRGSDARNRGHPGSRPRNRGGSC